MFEPEKAWRPHLDWETPAGRCLLALVEALPGQTTHHITVFGSAPLQLTLDRNFLSADVDIISVEDFSEVIVRKGLGKGQTAVYIEQVPENVFMVSPTWKDRAYSIQVKSVLFTFPHPIDILVSKVKRLAPKDLEAFRLVYGKTAHPTPDELKTALQRVVDLYRPAFDEENPGGDAIENTRILWRELYQKEIDPRKEIIAPALAARREAYGENVPQHISRLRERLEYGSGVEKTEQTANPSANQKRK